MLRVLLLVCTLQPPLVAATLDPEAPLDLAYVESFGKYGVGPDEWARPTHAVLVDEEGAETLLVVDNGNGRVLKLRDGKQVGSFGDVNGTGDVHAPSCLATDGKVLAVADARLHQVVVYDLATGGYLRSVGSAEVLNNPISVAIRKAPGGGAGAHDELWVVEYKGHRVSVLDFETGELRRTLGKGERGEGEGYLSEPRDLAFLGADVVVTDLSNHRLVVFNAQSGAFRRALPGKFDQPFGVAVLPGMVEGGGDALLVSEYHKQFGRIQLLDTEGNELAPPLKYVPDASSEHGKRHIGGLNYIHVDVASRRAFVGDMQSHVVHELTLDPARAKEVRARDEAAMEAHRAKTEL